MYSAVAQRRLDVLSLASFVALGLPDGMLGTAWPAMRASLHAPVSYLGLILLAATVGSVIISAFIGRILRRSGVARLLAAGLSCAAVAAAGFALAPAIGVVIGIAVLFGLSAGTLDGGLNTAIGLSGRGPAAQPAAWLLRNRHRHRTAGRDDRDRGGLLAACVLLPARRRRGAGSAVAHARPRGRRAGPEGG